MYFEHYILDFSYYYLINLEINFIFIDYFNYIIFKNLQYTLIDVIINHPQNIIVYIF